MNNSLNNKLNILSIWQRPQQNLNDSRSLSSLNHSHPSSEKREDNNKKRRAVLSTSLSLSSRSGLSAQDKLLLDTNNLKNPLILGRSQPLSPRLTDKESNEALISKYNTRSAPALFPLAGSAPEARREGRDERAPRAERAERASNISGRKVLKFTEKDWKERWLRKFNNLIDLGMYSPDSSDKLLFSYLNEKKQYLKSKYTFNEYLSGSQEIRYNFNKHSKKIDLNYLYKILNSFFNKLDSLISFPYLEVLPDKVKIRLFYYVLPSITKKIIHQGLHRYIRSDEKLYKELILRRKFKSIMEKFKIKLFIAKWKEDKLLVSSPYPFSFLKEFSFENLYAIHSFKEISSSPIKADSASTSEKVSKLNLIVLSSASDKHGAGEAGAREDNPVTYTNTSLRAGEDLFQLKTLDFITSSKASDANYKDTREILKNNSLGSGSAPATYGREDLESVIEKNRPQHIRNARSPFPFGWLRPLSPKGGAGVPELIKSEGLVHAPFTNLKDRKVSTLVSLNKNKFKYLIYILEKLFKKTIILELVKLKYPYHESNILSQVLGLSSKNKSFRKLMIKLLYTANISNPTNKVITKNFSIIPSYLSGLKVKLAGRLITQRVVPRFTVQSFQIGSLARGKINFMNSSRITLKNKRGAFSFTVTTSHIFEK